MPMTMSSPWMMPKAPFNIIVAFVLVFNIIVSRTSLFVDGFRTTTRKLSTTTTMMLPIYHHQRRETRFAQNDFVPIIIKTTTSELITTSSSFSLMMTNNYNNDNTNEKTDDSNSHLNSGIFILMTVPIAWGTFEPAIRYVYEIQPTIPPVVFQLAYYTIATSALSTLVIFQEGTAKEDSGDEGGQTSKQAILIAQDNGQDCASYKDEPNHPLPPHIRGGIELGTYLFLGNGLQVIGLKTVASDRAAFLLQLTTIFVPIIQSLLVWFATSSSPSSTAARSSSNVKSDKGYVSNKTWLACFVALVGVIFIGIDDSSGSSNIEGGSNFVSQLSAIVTVTNGLEFSIGDFYIALGAIFYSFHCIRLEKYAKNSSALKLATTKAATETFWCAVVVAISLLVAMKMNTNYMIGDNDTVLQAPVSIDSTAAANIIQQTGNNIIDYVESFFQSMEDHTISTTQWSQLSIATIWTGLVTIAYTIFAQSIGQATVKPTTANLIYTTQPFFTAIIAYIVLGETLGIPGYIGGILIGSAVLLVVL